MKTAECLQLFKRHKVGCITTLLLVAIGAVPLWRTLPATADDIRRSACLVNGSSQLCLISGRDTIVLHSDTVAQQGTWMNKHWWWPSCGGRVATIGQGIASLHHGSWNDSLPLATQLAAFTDSIAQLLHRKSVEHKELEYYLRSHGVQDEGYTPIAQYAEQQIRETDSLRLFYNRLRKVSIDGHTRIARRYLLHVSWYDEDGTLQHEVCRPSIVPAAHRGEPIVVQTRNASKPWGVYAVRRMPWTTERQGRVITTCIAEHDSTRPYRALLVHGHSASGRTHDLNALFARDGSPLFNKYGRFVGIVSKQIIKKNIEDVEPASPSR